MSRTDRYTAWWPWLRRLDAPEGLDAGARWRCVVRSPLGYRVRFEVRLDRVDAPGDGETVAAVTATVTGDIAGRAAIELTATGPGSALRFSSDLRPVRPLLRHLTRLAPPVARLGHDHILRAGVEQFRSRALAAPAAPATRGPVDTTPR